jgi:hypothetical protein
MSEKNETQPTAKPLLAASAIKEAVEILSAEMSISLHFSKYPQDRWKNESEPPEISRLISTAEFHNKRWQEIKSVIEHLVAVPSTCP